MTKKELELEYLKLEEELDSLPLHEDADGPVDNLSQFYCNCCGNRLTKAEWHEWEDTCDECMWNETSGLSDVDSDEEVDE